MDDQNISQPSMIQAEPGSMPHASISSQTSPTPASTYSNLIKSQTTSHIYTYATFLQRFGATLIDLVLLGVFVFLMTVIPSIIFVLLSALVFKSDQASSIFGLVQIALQLLTYILCIIYPIYFTGKTGQTLGKKALHIKVVQLSTGEHPSFVQAFVREIIGKIISQLIFGLGYLWPLWDEKKQAIHDKIAGTIVVQV